MGCNYPIKDNPSLTDQFLIWDVAASDWRRAVFQVVFDLFEANITFPDAGRPEPNTQYAAPAATGFNIQITDNNEDTHLILTPATSMAAGTITLPAKGIARDKQIVIVNSTQQITSLTIDANGAAGVSGAPSSMGADDFFELKYDSVLDTWYRVG